MLAHTVKALPRAGGLNEQAGRFVYALHGYTVGFEAGRMAAMSGGQEKPHMRDPNW